MKTRYTARAVIVDDKNNVAILSVQSGRYYKIPGGEIEDGETAVQAIIRESREEAGCEIEIFDLIGESEFVGAYSEKEEKFTDHSICYLAKSTGSKSVPRFTQIEQSRKFALRWTTFDDALGLFTNAKPSEDIEIQINKRDLAFIKQAKEILDCSGP